MISRLIGFLAVVPASILLTISFFVLYVLKKLEDKELKVFGYFVAVLLWVAASVVLAVGLHVLLTGKPIMGCPMMAMKSKHCMMSGKMKEMKPIVSREQSPAASQKHVKEGADIKQQDSGCSGNKGVVYKTE
jgi:hypothetical protein